MSEQEPKPDNKTEQPAEKPETQKAPEQLRAERISEINQQLDRYEGPRNDRELELRAEEMRQQYEHTSEGIQLSDESRAQLDEKMKAEIDALQERLKEYQSQYAEVIGYDIEQKQEELRRWAEQNGVPPEDYITFRKTEAAKPWETGELMIAVDANHYSKVLEWLRTAQNMQIDYSWAGRMAAYDQTPEGKYKPRSAFRDFVFFESNEEGERVVRPRHEMFKQFAAERGMQIPDADEIKAKIKKIDRSVYDTALKTIYEKMQTADESTVRRLAELKGKLEAALLFMDIGVENPKEEYNLDKGEMMSDQETSYNDIIYNADDFLSPKDWEEVGIPEKDRLDFGIDGEKIEELCGEFGEELLKQGIYK